jgi:hypothetical protein
MAKTMGEFRVTVGPERMVLTDGLQPFMFRSSKGTLFLQAQFTGPPGFKCRPKDVIPGDGTCGNVISRDNGKTWQRYVPDVWRQQMPYFEGSYGELRDGTILLVEWIGRGPSPRGDFRIHLWESDDEMRSWRGPVAGRLHMAQAKTRGYDDGGRPYSGLTLHRGLLEMPNGGLLAAAYCWFKGDDTPCSYQPRMCKFRSIVLRSEDRGRHWQYVSTIAVDPEVGEEGFDEPVIVRLSKGPKVGRLICLMRTGSNQCPIYQAVSDDEGANWSKPRKLGFFGVDPDLIEMADGVLACSFGWRTKNWTAPSPPPKLGNYVVFSRDQGETWTNLTRLPIEPVANTPWTTCYTTVREVAPGRLLVVYDIGLWGQPVRYIGSREVGVYSAQGAAIRSRDQLTPNNVNG